MISISSKMLASTIRKKRRTFETQLITRPKQAFDHLEINLIPGWWLRFCRHISGKHQNGLYKTKNIAFEQEKIRPTKSKHPTPLLLGHKAKEAPTKSKSFKFAWYIPAPKVWFKCTLKIIPGKKCIL